MPKTDAERSAAYRERRSARVAGLEATLADRDRQLGEARAEIEGLRAEVERISSAQCKHPAEAVDGGTCRACGADVW